jgi:1-acyl-sn-glycerol-3-phosphate acyltransferase
MIRADKRRWFSAWLARHAERRLRRTFDRLLVAGARELTTLARTRPLLVVANHSAWWDAMMVLVLSERVLGLDGHALMDATHLARLRFFALTGAIGVDLRDARDGARAILHCARLLDRPGRALWMFPQGEERPLHEPLVFRPGSTSIARLAPTAAVVPLALVYGFGPAEKPLAFASFGPPLARGSTSREAQQDAVSRQLQRVRERQSGRELDAFEPAMIAPRSRVGSWASAGLDRLVGHFVLEQPTRPDPQLPLSPAYAPRTERTDEGQQQ